MRMVCSPSAKRPRRLYRPVRSSASESMRSCSSRCRSAASAAFCARDVDDVALVGGHRAVLVAHRVGVVPDPVRRAVRVGDAVLLRPALEARCETCRCRPRDPVEVGRVDDVGVGAPPARELVGRVPVGGDVGGDVQHGADIVDVPAEGDHRARDEEVALVLQVGLGDSAPRDLVGQGALALFEQDHHGVERLGELAHEVDALGVVAARDLLRLSGELTEVRVHLDERDGHGVGRETAAGRRALRVRAGGGSRRISSRRRRRWFTVWTSGIATTGQVASLTYWKLRASSSAVSAASISLRLVSRSVRSRSSTWGVTARRLARCRWAAPCVQPAASAVVHGAVAAHGHPVSSPVDGSLHPGGHRGARTAAVRPGGACRKVLQNGGSRRA